MTQEELDKIVVPHQHWLKEDCEGWEDMRANLTDANPSHLNTCRAGRFSERIKKGNQLHERKTK